MTFKEEEEQEEEEEEEEEEETWHRDSRYCILLSAIISL